jgi:hypothetical protein
MCVLEQQGVIKKEYYPTPFKKKARERRKEKEGTIQGYNKSQSVMIRKKCVTIPTV